MTAVRTSVDVVLAIAKTKNCYREWKEDKEEDYGPNYLICSYPSLNDGCHTILAKWTLNFCFVFHPICCFG